MPVVTIRQSKGKTKEQRELLIKKVTQAFEEAYGISGETVTVFFRDYEDAYWGKGGVLHEDKKSKT